MDELTKMIATKMLISIQVGYGIYVNSLVLNTRKIILYPSLLYILVSAELLFLKLNYILFHSSGVCLDLRLYSERFVKGT